MPKLFAARVTLVLIVGQLLLLAGCQVKQSRTTCVRDQECARGDVCLPDDLCLPPLLATRRGLPPGHECHVVDGAEMGCDNGKVCRMGYCKWAGGLGEECEDSPENNVPLFGGVGSALPDGPDAILVGWAPASDETPHASLTYRVFMRSGTQTFDYTRPFIELVGQSVWRAEGLTAGVEYEFAVMARDEGGKMACNAKSVKTSPVVLGACVDYDTSVKPILEGNCVRCHSGPEAPQALRLDTYEGVHAGGNTGSEVVRCKPDMSLIYQKVSMPTPPVGVRMPFDGPPYLSAFQIETIQRWVASGAPRSCATAEDICNDAVSPTFAGLTSATTATSGTSASLCWNAGSDNATAAGALVYDVFQADGSGQQVFSAIPRKSSAPGATCVDVDGLTPGAQFCWVVRVRDAAGNRDANVAERCLTMPEALCVDYATVIQPIFNAECKHCHSGAAAPRNLKLDTYAGVKAGGLTGNEIVACQPDDSLLFKKISMDKPPVGARMPFDGPPYLTDAQTNIIRRWIDEGGRSSCNEVDPCSDPVPPSFAGVTTVTAVSSASAQVCWAAATDNLTATGDIVYDAYWSTTSGGQSYTNPGATSPPGATCLTVNALSPGTQTCFVVRARDGGGNRDSNTSQTCVTLPALPAGCVDYATYIQPLLEQNCTRCHDGATPPQLLRLGTYEDVIAGSVRRSEVDACNAAGSLLVNKISASPSIGKRMPYDGPPYLTTAQINMVTQWVNNGAQKTCSQSVSCSDLTPPTFAGVSSVSAVDATTLRVCWAAATDAASPASTLRYDVYEATTSAGQVFTQPAQHSVTAQTCVDVPTGPNTNLCFVVRARDLVGNVSTNTQELCATTPAASCAVEYATHVRPILAARCTYCHSGDTGRRFLDLSSYGGVLAGGVLRREVTACTPATSLLIQKTAGSVCGKRMPFDGAPYLAPSQMAVLERWIESGARETCSGTTPCADTTPPTFFGVSSVTSVGATTARVCWTPATDNSSPASAITYDVYDFTTVSSTSVPPYSAAAGATCLDVPVPSGRQSCFVVRARDLKGNRTATTKSLCVQMAGACLDYSTRVQPLFNARCIQCHSGSNPPKGIRWDNYANAHNGEVYPCYASDSNIMDAISGGNSKRMPYDTSPDMCSIFAPLSGSQQRLIEQWINQGANAGCPNGGC